MGGHNGLRHRGHAHGVRAQHPGGTDLRRRFVLGAGEVHIDALAQGDGQLLRSLPGVVLESGRVHMAHVREPGAELLQIGAAKGADTEEFDVVGNQHDVPGREGGVHRAGSVGDYQRFRPQQPQHPDGIADILKGPALIGVEAALHHRHVLTRQAAEHEPARVVRGGGSLHVGHILIGDGNGGLHFVAQRAQAGAQDQQAPGAERPQAVSQRLGALLILCECIFHLTLPPYSFWPHSRQNTSPLRAAAPQKGHTAPPCSRAISRSSRSICWRSPSIS